MEIRNIVESLRAVDTVLIMERLENFILRLEFYEGKVVKISKAFGISFRGTRAIFHPPFRAQLCGLNPDASENREISR